jgi:hypothetical protein
MDMALQLPPILKSALNSSPLFFGPELRIEKKDNIYGIINKI